MTIDQALELAAALVTAANKAVAEGKPVVDLAPVLQAADDAAREELQIAINEAQK